MNAAQLINQSSGDFEYYTPQPIIEAARATMGGIDLDPASSLTANLRVGASTIFTCEGLSQTWSGRVWLNHPFSREHNAEWIDKLIFSYRHGLVTQACCITFAATSERWFQPLLAYPQCFLCPRTNYYLPDGTLKRGVTKGSVVTYLGPSAGVFKLEFAKLGVVKVAI